MLSNPVTHDERWALFLDVDGTLLELAETPQSVHVSERLKQLLSELTARLDGALALVSGRGIADLDSLFAPLRLCASGVHGFERRDAVGRMVRPHVDPQQIELARALLEGLADRHPGLLLEDKGSALALHFRRAPELGTAVRRAMNSVCERLGPQFVIQAGKCVVEIRPAGYSKGSSVRAFMQEAPFLGRTPVYLGDDVTDEHAFAAVNELHGISIRVGDDSPTLARHRMRSVSDVMHWLQRVPQALADLAHSHGRILTQPK